MTNNLTQTPYEIMGGESHILQMVERFYFYMDTLPEAKDIRDKHEPNLAMAKEKLYKFLSGWLGGPDLFIEEFGHPMLRRRHFKFVIEQTDKKQWMLCMSRVVAEMEINENLKQSLLASFDTLATRMVNQ